MNINKIIKAANSPKPYDKGTDTMWTDKHISKLLLDVHINPEIEAASRTPESIIRTVRAIEGIVPKGSTILDLGCGPGIYTEQLARKGYKITGVDFSMNSIDYAIKQRNKYKYDIEYINDNYLNLDFKNQFDLIMMIYCDFGVLVPEDRELLLKVIYKALKPGGIFLFDAIDEGTIERLNFESSWEMAQSGFWKESPYICLSKNFHFPENKATLEQHLILDEDHSFQLYRFWNHYFNEEDVEMIVRPFGFSHVESIKNLLTGSSPYNDHGVVFYKVCKSNS